MRPFLELTWVELKLFAREPLTVVFVLVLPVVMLLVLNAAFADEPVDPAVWEGHPAIDFYTPSYVALVIASTGVLSLPLHLAGYREQGVLRRFHASALPSGSLLGAQAVVASVGSGVGSLLLTVAALASYDAAAPRSVVGVVVAFLLVVLTFAVLGALLGMTLPSARAAQGLGVLLFFTFLMLGGPGPPREVLPPAMDVTAALLPVTHAGDLLRAPWLDGGWDLRATGVLTAVLAISALLLVLRTRSEETW